MTFPKVIDGLSNTIMVVEASDGVPWTKPADLKFEPGNPLPKLGHFPNILLVLFADASVRSIPSPAISEQTLRAAITMDGKEVLGPDW
jgi:hypothetical protein